MRIVVGMLNSSQRMAFINLDVSVLYDQVRKLKISTDLSCGIGQGRNGNTFFVHFFIRLGTSLSVAVHIDYPGNLRQIETEKLFPFGEKC